MHYARSHDHEGRGYSSHHHIKLSYLSYYHLPSPHIFLPNRTHYDRSFLKRTQYPAPQPYLPSSHLTSATTSNQQAAKKRITTSFAHLHEPTIKQEKHPYVQGSMLQKCYWSSYIHTQTKNKRRSGHLRMIF
jgi:hypothetical protein